MSINITRSLEHAGELARRAKEEGAGTVIVSGGDGTVRTVVEAMAHSGMPVLIIPTGTENLLACEFGLSGSVESSLDTLDHGKIRHLDLGRVNDRYFMAVAGVGFDGEVIRRLQKIRKGHITQSDYFWPICRAFWEYRSPRIRVVADGQTISDEPSMVFVGNISRYAAGLGILPDADGSDGWLDLTIYKYQHRYQLIGHSVLTALHRSHTSKSAIRLRCRQVSITSSQPGIPVQLDGDPGPSLPLHIQIDPAAAQIITPPPAGEPYAPPVKHYHLRRWLCG